MDCLPFVPCSGGRFRVGAARRRREGAARNIEFIVAIVAAMVGVVSAGTPCSAQLCGEMQALQTPGSFSDATGLSADGTIVVGSMQSAFGQMRGAKWNAVGTLWQMPTLGGKNSQAVGVSANGSTIVGWAQNASSNWRPFRWTASEGMHALGTTAGTASATSADGSVVVGFTNAALSRAFIWTAAEGVRDLGTLGGTDAAATSVSANGVVVVGWSKEIGRAHV